MPVGGTRERDLRASKRVFEAHVVLARVRVECLDSLSTSSSCELRPERRSGIQRNQEMSDRVRFPERQSAAGSAGRNKAAILDALSPSLHTLASSAGSESRYVLELASGEGEHLAHIAVAFPSLTFVPTEADTALCRKIDERCRAAGLTNLVPAIQLDFDEEIGASESRNDGHRRQGWEGARAAAAGEGYAGVLLFNVVHIVPWPTVESIFKATASLMAPGSLLFLYGAFNEDGQCTSQGNASVSRLIPARAHMRCSDLGAPSLTQFDAVLRGRDPRFGE